ncbi:hypothetical protein C8F01DRAFT_273794 [Mycena amicta]|nr:hypothetical protein C8F01DRAFT_273794 [Mycena amicta]
MTSSSYRRIGMSWLAEWCQIALGDQTSSFKGYGPHESSTVLPSFPNAHLDTPSSSPADVSSPGAVFPTTTSHRDAHAECPFCSPRRRLSIGALVFLPLLRTSSNSAMVLGEALQCLTAGRHFAEVSSQHLDLPQTLTSPSSARPSTQSYKSPRRTSRASSTTLHPHPPKTPCSAPPAPSSLSTAFYPLVVVEFALLHLAILSRRPSLHIRTSRPRPRSRRRALDRSLCDVATLIVPIGYSQGSEFLSYLANWPLAWFHLYIYISQRGFFCPTISMFFYLYIALGLDFLTYNIFVSSCVCRRALLLCAFFQLGFPAMDLGLHQIFGQDRLRGCRRGSRPLYGQNNFNAQFCSFKWSQSSK